MLWEAIKLANQSVRRNALRSILTLLGIVIGVGAVIAMVTVGNGTTQKVTTDLSKLGSNMLIARPERETFGPGGSGEVRSFKERDVGDLLTLYGVTDSEERAALLNLAREANTPGWWHAYSDVLPTWLEPYVGLEAAASIIRTYQIQFVPGLLQTEGYARALIRQGAAESEEDQDESHVRAARRSCAGPTRRSSGSWSTRAPFAARSAAGRSSASS